MRKETRIFGRGYAAYVSTFSEKDTLKFRTNPSDRSMGAFHRLLSLALLAGSVVGLMASPARAMQGGGSDSCTTAQPISGPGLFGFDNSNATTGSVGQNEYLCYQFGSSTVDNDVWFEWTSDCTGVGLLTTCGLTSVDTKVAIYPGGSCPQAGSTNNALACNDDTCGLQSELSFAIVNSNTYLIQVGTFPGATGGPGQFQISYPQGCGGGGPAQAVNYHVVFSGDYKGPLHGDLDANGVPIRESDLLASPTGGPTPGPQSAPEILLDGTDLGLQAFGLCDNPQPGEPCQIELDAFSRGNDHPLKPDGLAGGSRIYFTVDEWARGIAQNPQQPSVSTEGSFGGKEASADVFKLVEGVLPGPVPPPGPNPSGPWGNIAVIDGDGFRSSSGYKYPGYGLKEPNAPSQGPLNQGSNSDSMNLYRPDSSEVEPVTLDNPAFFSLDGNLFDPLEGITGSNSAAANGQFNPGDILISTGVGGGVFSYASATDLGLDQNPLNEFKDDVDALILWDNGDGVYQPSTLPYEWIDGETDMLIFSVRRGSPIIGTPDSIFGIPICEGDLLIPPVEEGLSLTAATGAPGIFVSAESMGLRGGRDGKSAGDDLGGADTSEDPIIDCNENGAEDAEDISNGTSDDFNANGVPDECEEFVQFCSGQDLPSALGCQCPCGNCDTTTSDLAGCGNGNNSSWNAGASLIAVGSSSVGLADFTLSASGLIPNQPGLYFQGNNAVNNGSGNQFGDGLRCAGGSVIRLQVRVADSAGRSETNTNLISGGGVASGDLRRYQLWYRDPNTSPCGATFNLSNGLQVLFGP